MKFSIPTILGAAGRALAAAAEHLEGSPSGQLVEADVKKTINDGLSAAITAVRQGATSEATSAATTVFTRLGLPAAGASALAGLVVAEGEPFITALMPSTAASA